MFNEALGRPFEVASNGGPINPIIKPLTDEEAKCLNCTLPVSVCCGRPTECHARYKKYLQKQEQDAKRRKVRASRLVSSTVEPQDYKGYPIVSGSVSTINYAVAVYKYLLTKKGQTVTSLNIAKNVGLSKVSITRYVRLLIDAGVQIEVRKGAAGGVALMREYKRA